jgi:hypothetical protein
MPQNILANPGKFILIAGAFVGLGLLAIVLIGSLFGLHPDAEAFDLVKMLITSSLSAAGGAGIVQVQGLAAERDTLRATIESINAPK